MSKVFISYSHEDETWKDRLQTQLAVLEYEGLFSVWEDRQIETGDDWYPEIEKALNEADVAILLISAHFLTSKFIRGEEIPRLLERREQEGIRVIPLILKPCPWHKIDWLSAIQGASKDNIILSGLSEHEQEEIFAQLADKIDDLLKEAEVKKKAREAEAQATAIVSPKTIYTDRLPTVKGDFFGRAAELKMLDSAWNGNETKIIQFIAAGGTGKTALLRYWIDKNNDQFDALIAWSFYSQGSSEDKQTSATPFFSAVLEKFGEMDHPFSTDEAKGEFVAELLQKQRTFLVLDGLEPLQHGGATMRGALKDRALLQMLKTLAGQNSGLCVITTRIAAEELQDRAAVESHDLENLELDDGVQLLRSFEINDSQAELENVVREFGCHALALNLLGNAVHTYLEGDIRRRDTLPELIDDADQPGKHAIKVMRAYENWLAGTPELQLLSILGLFDHPLEPDVLQVLLDAQIPHLTAGFAEKQWKIAIRDLREKHHLLAVHEPSPLNPRHFDEERGEISNTAAQISRAARNDTLLDCHPLIREHFGAQLKNNQPKAWKTAHKTLYKYYKALPEKEFPDTLEEMQPLFHAVAHGCAAGLHQQALDKVYWPRIKRGEKQYIYHKLGAFGDDLTVVSHFFEKPWRVPAQNLEPMYQAGVLNWAGFGLRALGRLREAVEPTQAAVENFVQQKNWQQAAINASNLSQLQLTIGDVADAIKTAHQSVEYADQSDDLFQRMGNRTTYADALYQAGQQEEALALFQEEVLAVVRFATNIKRDNLGSIGI